MKRREALALVAAGAGALAGCSSGDGDGDGGEDEREDGTEPVENTTTTDGNSSDVSEGSDGNESDSDGQDDEPEGPSEEELAQEDVDAAQTALSEAVAELESQGTSYGSLSEPGDQGPPVVASLESLSAGPVRDKLSGVQTEIDAAREHETTGDQDEVLTAIETAKDWLHSVLDAYQPERDLYLEANYAVQDYTAEGSEPDVQGVRRSIDQAQSPVEAVTGPYNAIEYVGRLDAISQAGFATQRDRIGAEFESGQAVADAIEALQAGDELFTPNWETMQTEGVDPIEGTPFKDAKPEYGNAVSAAGEMGGSFGAAKSYVKCFASDMQTAADDARFALSSYRADRGEYAAANRKNAESALDSADGCSFGWSA